MIEYVAQLARPTPLLPMKKICFCSCILLISFYVNAQVDVDLFTGKLQAHIPLFEVSQGPLSVPVSIDYQGGGIKVEQSEGSAGMGWELNAGGAIMRELRGLPDDFSETTGNQRKGWLSPGVASAVQSFTAHTDSNLSDCSDEKLDYDFIATMLYKDTEADIFSFYAPGLSGQFVFDGSGNPQLIPYQDVRIETKKNANGEIISFKIKNNQGVTYQFSATETLTRSIGPSVGATQFAVRYNQFRTPITFTTAWHLTTIRFANGDKIKLTYKSQETSDYQTELSTVNTAGTITQQYTVQEEVNVKQLETISSSRQTVTFEWTDVRIASVTQTVLGSSQARKFVFTYGFAYDATEPNPNMFKTRAFLVQLTQVADCVPDPAYKFHYSHVVHEGGSQYSVPLGFERRNRQDLWGYFNNGTATNLIPRLYYNAAANNAERFRVIPLSTEQPTLSGADRLPKQVYPEYGSLDEITYPAGGTTNVYYENNEYYDSAANMNKLGGGVRVFSLYTSGSGRGSTEKIIHYWYKRADGVKSSGRLSYPLSYAFPNGTEILRTTHHMGPESYVMYERVYVDQNGKGETAYTYYTPGTYPATTSSTEWGATNNRVARSSATCPPINNLVSGYYSFPWVPNQNFDYARGLLRSVRDFDESGLRLSEKVYSYQNQSVSGATVNGLRYEAVDGKYVFGLYALSVNTGKIIATETVRLTDELSPGGTASPTNFIETATAYTYNSFHGLLDHADVTNSNGNVYRTKYRYAKDFAITNPDPTDTAAIAIKALNDSLRHATIVQTTNYNGSYVTDASLLLYRDYGGNRILPYKSLSFPRKAGYTDASVSTNGSGKQLFSYNTTDYFGTRYLTYVENTPTGWNDHRNSKGGQHYGYVFSSSLGAYVPTVPIATFSGALPEQCFYEGFERNGVSTDFGFGNVNNIGPGWAGNAGVWYAGLERNRDNIQRGSSKYKGAVWVNATTATDITFKVTGAGGYTLQKTASYTSSDINKWKYLEVFFDLSTAPSTFSLFVKTSALASLDELLFIPAEASATTMAFDDSYRKVAQADERGNGVFTVYDELGRVKSVLNKDKDLIQYNEYRIASDPLIPASSAFIANLAEQDIRMGSPVTFTESGTNSCQNATVTSRQWKLNGVNVGTGASYTYTPSATGSVSIEYSISLSNGQFSTSKQSFCVSAPLLEVDVTVVSLDDPTERWIDKDETSICFSEKRFTATLASTGCGAVITYTWAYRKSGEEIWNTVDDGDAAHHTLEFSPDFGTGYSMRCTVSQQCSNTEPCKSYDNEIADSMFIQWVNFTTCP